MNVSFEGFNESAATFIASGAVLPGTAVKITSNGTVAPCADGDKFAGVALNAADGYAAVQLGGYVKCTYTGTAPTVGFAILASGGTNKVKTATAGNTYLVLDVDTTAKTVGFLL